MSYFEIVNSIIHMDSTEIIRLKFDDVPGYEFIVKKQKI